MAAGTIGSLGAGRGRSAHRGGFTLVELLVVITIIGMLMALLVPAVSAAREAGRRTTCQNNQKNIAGGLLGYEAAQQMFPGWRNVVGDYKTNLNYAHEASWVPMIFPHIERSDLWEIWAAGLGPRATGQNPYTWQDRFKYVKLFNCPSDPTDYTGPNDTPNSYIANCGLYQRPFYGQPTGTNATQYGPPQAYGIFTDKGKRPGYSSATPTASNVGGLITLNGRNLFRDQERINVESISSRDGTSTTILLTENIQADTNQSGGAWARRNASTNVEATPWVPTIGFWWHRNGNSTNTSATEYIMNRINSDPMYVSSVNDAHARPSANHGDQVVVTFADGHQHLLRQNIDVVVYFHLVTPDGRAARVPNGTVPGGDLKNGVPGALSDGDY